MWSPEICESCEERQKMVWDYIHTYVRTHMHVCMHAYMHACMHIYLHTYMLMHSSTPCIYYFHPLYIVRMAQEIVRLQLAYFVVVVGF